MARPSRLHPAWTVLAALTVGMMAASGLRAMFGVYIRPMEVELGWSRGALSGVAAFSLLLLGAVGPFAGRLADRWGPRRVIAISLAVLGLGAVGSSFVTELWQLYGTVGVLLAVGAGGLSLATGSTVVARWFETRRGLVMGIAAGSMSAGQLVVIPLAAALTVWLGWRASYLWLGLGVAALALPACLWLVRDDPEEIGRRPYGATGAPRSAAEATAVQRAGRVSLGEASRFPQFWLLMATFFVCGWTTGGVVLTHFIPHALDHSFTEFQASTALGVMGAMNILGTMASGWLCDRFGRRGPLATYYALRGLSLLFLLYVSDMPSLILWSAVFGLNFISTIPPTTTLTANIFGRYSVGELSGWIFFAHQVGAALGAAVSGWIFEGTGSYTIAFVAAGLMAVVAGGLTLAIREEPVITRPRPGPAPAIAPA
jgi:MFS family permease